MKTTKRSLVTWGAHHAHGLVWLKLHRFSAKKNAERVRQGWQLAFCAPGEKPVELPVS